MVHVLLVEDASDIGEILSVALTSAHNVTTVHNGNAARPVLAGGGIDLLIVDLVLPDCVGTELADEAARCGIPQLMMSGDAAVTDQLTQEGRLCLRKPFTLTEFLSAVRAQLAGL